MREFMDIQEGDESGGKKKRSSTKNECRPNGEGHEDVVDDEFIYDLTAVLIHNGPSAYSGHFIAHVLDERYAVLSIVMHIAVNIFPFT